MMNRWDALGVFVAVLLIVGAVIIVAEIVFYILRSFGLYRMAQNAGMPHPWLAWVPVANGYILGSLCDRSVYCLSGRRWNMAVVLTVAQGAGLLLSNVLQPFAAAFAEAAGYFFEYGGDGGYALGQALSGLVSVAALVISSVALYHLYRDYAPGHEVAYTVLSVLFSGIAPAILIFILRDRVPLSVWYAQGQPCAGYGGPSPGLEGGFPQGPGPWQDQAAPGFPPAGQPGGEAAPPPEPPKPPEPPEHQGPEL